jgi:hypothetical protein
MTLLGCINDPRICTVMLLLCSHDVFGSSSIVPTLPIEFLRLRLALRSLLRSVREDKRLLDLLPSSSRAQSHRCRSV